MHERKNQRGRSGAAGCATKQTTKTQLKNQKTDMSVVMLSCAKTNTVH